jgi:hypothetical protein
MPNPVDPCIPLEMLPENCRAVVVAEGQPQYTALPSVVTPGGQVITRWQFTEAERWAIIKGEDLYITLLSAGQISPFMPSIGPIDWREKEGGTNG